MSLSPPAGPFRPEQIKMDIELVSVDAYGSDVVAWFVALTMPALNRMLLTPERAELLGESLLAAARAARRA